MRRLPSTVMTMPLAMMSETFAPCRAAIASRAERFRQHDEQPGGQGAETHAQEFIRRV